MSRQYIAASCHQRNEKTYGRTIVRFLCHLREDESEKWRRARMSEGWRVERGRERGMEKEEWWGTRKGELQEKRNAIDKIEIRSQLSL
jgi:hypothetical protein